MVQVARTLTPPHLLHTEAADGGRFPPSAAFLCAHFSAYLSGPGLRADAEWPVRPLSADAEVAVNIRTGAIFSAMVAIAATIQLQPNGHRTRCFEPDVNRLFPVAAKAEN